MVILCVFLGLGGHFGTHFWKSPVESGFKVISHVEFDLKPISPVELDSKGHFWKKRGKTRINNHKWSFYACFHGPPRIPWG